MECINDIDNIVSGCPECAIVSGGGRVQTPPLCLIVVQQPFNNGIGHHGSPENIQRESICVGLPGFSVQMAYGLYTPRPMYPLLSENLDGGDYSNIWSPGSSLIG